MQQLPDDPSTVSVLEVTNDGRWLCMQVARNDNRAVETMELMESLPRLGPISNQEC